MTQPYSFAIRNRNGLYLSIQPGNRDVYTTMPRSATLWAQYEHAEGARQERLKEQPHLVITKLNIQARKAPASVQPHERQEG